MTLGPDDLIPDRYIAMKNPVFAAFMIELHSKGVFPTADESVALFDAKFPEEEV